MMTLSLGAGLVVVAQRRRLVLGHALREGDVLDAGEVDEGVVRPDSSPGAVIFERRVREPTVAADLLGEAVGAVPRVDAVGLRPEQRVEVAVVQAVTSVFAGFVITVMPSRPISSSVYSIPAFLQTFASSGSI